MAATVRRVFSVVTERSPLFLAGLSMGGFGALRIDAKYAGLFRAVSAHSSFTHFEQMRDFVEERLESFTVEAENHSVLDALQRQKSKLPAVCFACGTEDTLHEPNWALHRAPLDAKIEHEYAEYPGGHGWPYWETHLADSLRFFTRHL